MSFKHKEAVEICKKQEGFLGSHYPATVLAAVGLNKYLITYETHVTGDKTRLLTEVVGICSKDYKVGDRVDVYEDEGWWVGNVTRKVEPNYDVSLDNNGVELHSPFYKVRTHVDWENGNWVYC